MQHMLYSVEALSRAEAGCILAQWYAHNQEALEEVPADSYISAVRSANERYSRIRCTYRRWGLGDASLPYYWYDGCLSGIQIKNATRE